MKIKDLLSDESRWCKDYYDRNAAGLQADYLAKDAVRWCLLGAIIKCYDGNDRTVIANKIDKYVSDNHHMIGLVKFNDDKYTTYADVKKLVDTLDI